MKKIVFLFMLSLFFSSMAVASPTYFNVNTESYKMTKSYFNVNTESYKMTKSYFNVNTESYKMTKSYPHGGLVYKINKSQLIVPEKLVIRYILMDKNNSKYIEKVNRPHPVIKYLKRIFRMRNK